MVQAKDSGGVVAGATTTDSGGGYSLSLAPATYSVNYTKSSYASTSRSGVAVIANDQTALSVQMTTTATADALAGTVTDAASAAPIDGAAVKLLDGYGFGVATVSTDATGAYSIDSLSPGESYSEIFSAPGYHPQSSSVTVVGFQQTTTADAALQPDSTPPALSIDSGPSGTTANPRPSFGFSSPDGSATFTCSIDTGTASFGACSGPGNTERPASNLADGSYTFRVKATDPAENSTTQTRSFTVDTNPPNMSTTKLKVNSAKLKATVTFTGTDPVPSSLPLDFKCKIDKKPYRACGSPKTYKHLKVGKHKFRVKASDAAGNVDPTPAVKRFRIKP